jgi:hypothetical protein
MKFRIVLGIDIYTETLKTFRPGDVVVFKNWPNFSYIITKDHGLSCLNVYHCFQKGYN